MIKVFISQPMNGMTDKQIERERDLAIADATSQIKACYPEDWDEKDGNEVEVMDTKINGLIPGTHPLVYLGKSIEMMANADVVYFAKGWENARGCLIEHECAKKYGKHVMYF